MHGGEVFAPKIPSMNIMDLVKAVAPNCNVKHVGIRPGEKLHEVLVSEDEARNAVETDEMYIIKPKHPWWGGENWKAARPLADGFRYGSDTNTRWLSIEELRTLVE
jgi:UDP-N-acetylglucosamine 4,6-dehydratase/5-epimerase